MASTEEYRNLTKALDENDFKELVRVYMQEYYGTKEVNIVDGPWDGGNDLCIFKDGKQVKRNIQVTVQDNYEKKLKNDLGKSHANIENFGYASKLDFFISHPISQSKKDELMRMADVDYGIDLRIYDGNKIADESKRFPCIGDYLARLFCNNVQRNPLSTLNMQYKVLYDNISTGRNIAEVKMNFVGSFLLHYLYDKGPVSQQEVEKYIKNELKVLSAISIRETLDRYYESGLIDEDGDLISLTDAGQKEIERNIELSMAAEDRLRFLVAECLSDYGLVDADKIVFDKLAEVYKTHYDSEVDEINFIAKKDVKERRVINELKSLLHKHGFKGNTDELVKQLLIISGESEYLNKISAASMFAKLAKSNALEDYLSTFSKHLYLDTQILLQVLCIKYRDTDYDDSLYTAVKYLLEIEDQQREKIKLYTTHFYISEVAHHLWEAFCLRRFLDFPLLKELGESKNIFFNFYLYLSNTGLQIEDIEEFVNNILATEEDLPHNNKKMFIQQAENAIFDILELSGIEIIDISEADFNNYSVYRREYDFFLDSVNSYKLNKARNNDLLMLLYLSEKEYHIDPDTKLDNRPYLVTWDSTFYQARDIFTRKQNRDFWYIYTPYKLANRLALMTFKLDSKKLTYEIISLTENNFKASNDTISFIDTLSEVCLGGDIRESESIKNLVHLRKQQKKDSELGDYRERNSQNIPVDVIFATLVGYYSKKGNEDLIRKVIENDELADDVKKLIEDNCKYLQKHKKISNGLFEAFDKLAKGMG